MLTKLETPPSGLLRLLLGLVLWLVACAPAAGEPRPASPPNATAAAPPPAASAAATPAPPLRVRFSYSTASGSSLPYWVAQEAGLFAKYGLEADVSYMAATTAMSALLAHDVDLTSTAGAELVAAHVEGADVVAIAGVSSKVTQALYVAPTITAPGGLRGQRLGITRLGSLSDFAARYLLRQWNLRPDEDVAMIQVGGYPEILAALSAGGVDAGMLTPPITLQAQDVGYVELANLWTAPLEYPATLLARKRAGGPEDDEIARRFVRVIAESIRLVQDDRDLALRVLQAQTKTDDPRVLAATYEVYAPLFDRDLRLSREAFQAAIDQLAVSNPRAASASPDAMVDRRFVNELAQSGLLERLGAR